MLHYNYIVYILYQLHYWHIPTQYRGSGDAMTTSIYMVLPNLDIVCSWDTLWVSPSTSMQVAMVMASQFVMMYVYMVALPVLHDTSPRPS